MAINGNYVVRETTSNLARNPTLTVASVLTVFVSLAIVGTAVLVRQGAQNMTRRFEGGVEFIVFVEPEITEAQLAQVKADLERNPNVKRIDYDDGDDACQLRCPHRFGSESTLIPPNQFRRPHQCPRLHRLWGGDDVGHGV